MRQTVSEVIKQNKGSVCCNCGSSDNIEYHHIVPISLGGSGIESNIVPLCHRCHKAAHHGRHITHYLSHSNSGRKPSATYKDACKVYDMYANGEIGRRKACELLKCKKSAQITQQKWFGEYKEERGILKVKNNIDVIGTNSDLTNGMQCGYIVFNDGHVENMVYKDTGENDVEYIKRQSRNDYSPKYSQK